MMPTFDWAALLQRIAAALRMFFLIRIVMKIGEVIFNVCKTPMYLAVIVAALTYFPDTIAWIFIKIGEIHLKCFMIMLNVVMPEVFNAADPNMKDWADIWKEGLNLLPEDVLSIVNGIGVAEILGIITSTIMAGFMIKVYRKTMLRAGLL